MQPLGDEGAAAALRCAPSAAGAAPAAAAPDGSSASDEEEEEGGEEEEEDEEAEEGAGGDAPAAAPAAPPRRADWYDVHDSFVDDTDLGGGGDERTGDGAPVHTGYYVNKGAIERDAKRKPEAEPAGVPAAKRPAGVRPARPPAAAAAAPYDGTGPLGAAVQALRDVVAATPAPPAERERRALSGAMLEGLERVKLLLTPGADLPRYLTQALLAFMEPFATAPTLRRRLGVVGAGGSGAAGTAPASAAPAATALAADAAAAQPPAVAPPVAAAPSVAAAAAPARASAPPPGPPPSAEEVERGLAALRAAVVARVAVTRVALPSSEGDDFQARYAICLMGLHG